MIEIRRGDVVWGAPDPAVGVEQAGRRPLVVVSSERYLKKVPSLVVVVSVTSVDRGWASHVRLGGQTGLKDESYAMTEQIKAVDRRRIRRLVGRADEATMTEIDLWLREHLELLE